MALFYSFLHYLLTNQCKSISVLKSSLFFCMESNIEISKIHLLLIGSYFSKHGELFLFQDFMFFENNTKKDDKMVSQPLYCCRIVIRHTCNCITLWMKCRMVAPMFLTF